MSSQHTETPTYDTFISHASQDNGEALKICAFLEQQGLRCWVAPRDVDFSNHYPDEIVKGVRNSKSLILLLSEHTEDAQFVAMEVERAIHYRRRIFTIRLEEVGVPPSLELFLGLPHWIDQWAPDYQHRLESIPAILAGISSESFKIKPPSFQQKAVHFAKKNSVGLISVAILLFFAVLLVTPWVGSNPDTPDIVESIDEFSDEVFSATASQSSVSRPIKVTLDGYSRALSGGSILSPSLINKQYEITFDFDNGQKETIIAGLTNASVNVDETLPIATRVAITMRDLHEDSTSEEMTFPLPELALLVKKKKSETVATLKGSLNNPGSLRCELTLEQMYAFPICRIGNAIKSVPFAQLQTVIDKVVFSDSSGQMTNIVSLNPLKTQGDIVAKVHDQTLYMFVPKTAERLAFQYYFTDKTESQVMEQSNNADSKARKLASSSADAPALYITSMLNTMYMGLAPIINGDIATVHWRIFNGIENAMTSNKQFLYAKGIPVNELNKTEEISVTYRNKSGEEQTYTYTLDLANAAQQQNLAQQKKQPKRLIECSTHGCSFSWLSASQQEIDLIDDIFVGLDASAMVSISQDDTSVLISEMEKRRPPLLNEEREKNGNKPHSNLSFGTPVNVGGPTLLERLERQSSISVNKQWKVRANTRTSPILGYSWPVSPLFIQLAWIDGTKTKPMMYEVSQAQ
ncbi:TIR domain-containing protein [Alteromonas sp. 345S023]|uniref:TIR domain-containing protein n=1 Tax=Alteromonas profundi TaxID=2696062 RepID=A0A7X5LKL5_9ALTE|nr:toll/interleukin-1 receptor domain-containing protein [Alteromonas profundi]NDV90430.1 TIR domain-containing protein [Alteromonas profundi]